MAFEGLVPVPDIAVGAWIEPRLLGFGGRAGGVVPTGFAAYARVLHPAADERNALATWAQVGERTGRTAHALMQWRSVAAVEEVTWTKGRWPRRRQMSTTTSQWPGQQPETGNLPPETLSALLDVLEPFTADPGDCCHALWEGFGWIDGQGVGLLVAEGSAPPPPPPPALPREVLDGPRLRHPGRDYLLFRGPLRAALRMGDEHGGWFTPQSPNLLWPADRSWCLATEIDFDSTLVGGPSDLVDAVLSAPGLEAWPVGPDDDLTWNGDRVNG